MHWYEMDQATNQWKGFNPLNVKVVIIRNQSIDLHSKLFDWFLYANFGVYIMH